MRAFPLWWSFVRDHLLVAKITSPLLGHHQEVQKLIEGNEEFAGLYTHFGYSAYANRRSGEILHGLNSLVRVSFPDFATFQRAMADVQDEVELLDAHLALLTEHDEQASLSPLVSGLVSTREEIASGYYDSQEIERRLRQLEDRCVCIHSLSYPILRLATSPLRPDKKGRSPEPLGGQNLIARRRFEAPLRDLRASLAFRWAIATQEPPWALRRGCAAGVGQR